MNKLELLELSKKYDDFDNDTVLHFGLIDNNKHNEGIIMVDGHKMTSFTYAPEENYYIVSTSRDKRVALIFGSGFGIRASSPCDNIYNLFMEELGFSENDLKNLKFLGDCTQTVSILSKPEDFMFY